MKIKERITIVLEDITHSGEGVGRVDNMIVFVDGGVPGDTVEIEIPGIGVLRNTVGRRKGDVRA